MYAFTHHMATSVADAVGSVGEGKFLAGGHTLIPTMKQRLAQPGHIVDLDKVPELKGISDNGSVLTIKAMSRHAEVEASDVVRKAIPGLSALAGLIGDPQVRHRGTIGGVIANNDPVADYPAAVLALGATIVTDRRRIAAADYFQGLFTTALEDGELITAVEFPHADKFAYAKFRNPASRYALVGVAVAKRGGEVRVAVTGSGSDGVFRWTAAEQRLASNFSASALDGLTVDAGALTGDIHGSPEYRAHLVGVMAKRAVAAA
jgi:aerobic carbon-monoxide dehydrogenase medium subunit